MQEYVSVPLRGTTFLNGENIWRGPYWNLFPSPYGELHFSIRNPESYIFSGFRFPSPYGELHFSILPWYSCANRPPSFPSPYGELHFSIQENQLVKFMNRKVSVPLRGTTFLNKKRHIYTIILDCFRPLTGNYISQSGRNAGWRTGGRFPSPYGELHFSMILLHRKNF